MQVAKGKFLTMDQSKTVEVRIMKFSPYSSPIPLVFAGKFHPEILMGSNRAGPSDKRGAGKNRFLALNVNISKFGNILTKYHFL